MRRAAQCVIFSLQIPPSKVSFSSSLQTKECTNEVYWQHMFISKELKSLVFFLCCLKEIAAKLLLFKMVRKNQT